MVVDAAPSALPANAANITRSCLAQRYAWLNAIGVIEKIACYVGWIKSVADEDAVL